MKNHIRTNTFSEFISETGVEAEHFIECLAEFLACSKRPVNSRHDEHYEDVGGGNITFCSEIFRLFPLQTSWHFRYTQLESNLTVGTYFPTAAPHWTAVFLPA